MPEAAEDYDEEANATTGKVAPARRTAPRQ
jgi:hypothetical protein